MLHVSDVDVSYGDIRVLWSVSIDVSEGEVVALIGPNGAGKSTLLMTIMGVLRMNRGTITFKTLLLNRMPTHRIVEQGICIVPEGKGLFPDMTVLENLDMGAFLPRARVEKTRTIEWIYEILPVLRDRGRQLAGSLSGGEQQMLAIARTLMLRPTLLLLDEITLGLSPKLVKEVFSVVQQISRAGVGLLIVEQNVFMALKFATRGYVIENGRIGKQGDASSLLNDNSIKSAYLGKA